MILEEIQKRIKEALSQKKEFELSVLRMLLASIHNREIEKGKDNPLTEEEVLEVLRKELKKRNEAALAYSQGDRPQLAQKEKQEAEIIAQLLPPTLSLEEVEKVVDEVLGNFPGASLKDMGAIIKAVKEKTKGAAEGEAIAKIVKEKLSA
ncbi:MAG: GatB/YqeY domain-containing protein [Patescibacteria group bacterium]|nr:GatB/YqeY domain-containing protein [Patescibacteria group bacterium]